MMTPGARWKITVPAALGYGQSGAPPRIPPGATLVFDMELLSVRGCPPFRMPDPKAQKVTESGLRYEVLKATDGAPPGEADSIEIDFALWNDRGDLIDSSIAIDQPLQGTRDQMALGLLKEAPFLMKEGEEFLFQAPPALVFGDQPRGKLPPNSTTCWWIRLNRVGRVQPPPPLERPPAEKILRRPSGLGICTLHEGKGDPPARTDSVVVHYAGWLDDGTLFDSSFGRGLPVSFRLDQVISGWTEGLQEMRPGGIALLFIPPALGYGSGAHGKIPGDSTLTFRVELLEVRR